MKRKTKLIKNSGSKANESRKKNCSKCENSSKNLKCGNSNTDRLGCVRRVFG